MDDYDVIAEELPASFSLTHTERSQHVALSALKPDKLSKCHREMCVCVCLVIIGVLKALHEWRISLLTQFQISPGTNLTFMLILNTFPFSSDMNPLPLHTPLYTLLLLSSLILFVHRIPSTNDTNLLPQHTPFY